jgi:hypothetical protein
MADAAPITPAARWTSAMNLLHSLNEQLIGCHEQDRDRLERSVAEQEDVLLELEAPHLMAVVEKLKLLFDLDLDKPDRDGFIKSQIVEDLESLIGLDA